MVELDDDSSVWWCDEEQGSLRLHDWEPDRSTRSGIFRLSGMATRPRIGDREGARYDVSIDPEMRTKPAGNRGAAGGSVRVTGTARRATVCHRMKVGSAYESVSTPSRLR